MSNKNFAAIEEAIDAIAAGRFVIVVDDEDRENEGDLICAAELVSTEMINFMLTRGRGVLCVPVLRDRAAALRLEPATQSNSALHSTNFTVSVDLRTLTTGVSAAERAETVRALALPETVPEDLARPGHVYPLIAHEGGVLRRAGHTEAAVDLATLAGLHPAGALIEILDDDGTMARRDRLFEIAVEHTIPIITIEDLIRYRRRHEKLVKRVVETTIPTRDFGELAVYGYEVAHEVQEPMAFVKGDLRSSEAPLVRMHSSCFTGDVLESLRCDCGDQLRRALARITEEGVGAVVYLPQEGRGIGLLAKLKAYALQDRGLDTVEANEALGYRADMRDYGIGIQVLKDLGLSKVRLLTNNPKKHDAFIYYGYDLKVVSQEPIVEPANAYNERYLRAKRDKLGHVLPDDHFSDDDRTVIPDEELADESSASSREAS
jgi:3,4-dihydroxy 2-butanone 4-phosphate synthase/GTP cyclohydrolase II